MKTLTFLLIGALAMPAFAVTQWMDAAELDGEGNPLNGFVATRAFIDNRGGTADLASVRFDLNWTGEATAAGALLWANPENPWYGASNALMRQMLGTVQYTVGTVYYPPTDEWGPYWNADPTPENDEDPENDWEVFDSVPAGLAWDACMWVEGEDVHLFMSPAAGETTFNGDTYTLYDSDPMPQTVPEPGVLALLAVGLLAWNLRRRPTP